MKFELELEGSFVDPTINTIYPEVTIYLPLFQLEVRCCQKYYNDLQNLTIEFDIQNYKNGITVLIGNYALNGKYTILLRNHGMIPNNVDYKTWVHTK